MDVYNWCGKLNSIPLKEGMTESVWLKETIILIKLDNCNWASELMKLPFKIYGCKCSSEIEISLKWKHRSKTVYMHSGWLQVLFLNKYGTHQGTDGCNYLHEIKKNSILKKKLLQLFPGLNTVTLKEKFFLGTTISWITTSFYVLLSRWGFFCIC